MWSSWEIILVLQEYVIQKMTSQWEIGAIQSRIKEILSYKYSLSSVYFYSPRLYIYGSGTMPSESEIENAIYQMLGQ